MEILSDPTPDMLAMPRFDDGAIDMQELLRRLAEQVVNAVVDACVSSRGFEQKEHRKLSSLSIGSAHAF